MILAITPFVFSGRVARSVQCGARMLTRSLIDPAFTSVVVEVGRVRDGIDVTAWCRHMRTVEQALARLRNATDDPARGAPPLDRLARDAFIAVLALAQLLAGAYSANPRSAAALERTRFAVSQLLDLFEPYVTHGDREARKVLLEGEPLDTALERMFFV